MTPRRRRLGVIGSFVWDVIHGRDTRLAPVEEWGGITYSLGAFDVALSDDWEIVPLVKVGHDLADRARQFLGTLRRLAPDAAPIEVPHPNNRVVLHYQSAERRCERLSGGVPGWSWAGLKPLLGDLDALYINFLSGFELDLDVARLTRQHFRGPVYADLHSLLLGIQPDGTRIPQKLPDADLWCRCFDFVQVNEEEMALMTDDPFGLAARAFDAGVSSLTVTMGSRGIVYFAAPGFDDITDLRRPASFHASGGPIRTARIAAAPARQRDDGDPTGCGDVWGATYFSRLLAGDELTAAMRAAMIAAARNVEHRGATGLANFLRGELATT